MLSSGLGGVLCVTIGIMNPSEVFKLNTWKNIVPFQHKGIFLQQTDRTTFNM